MSSIRIPLLFLLLLLGAMGYAYQRGQTRQALLLARLQTLTADLRADNQRTAQQAATTMRDLRRIVYLNHNWPPDAAVLSQSEAVWRRIESLADSLRASSRPPAAGRRNAELQPAPTAAQLFRYQEFIQRLLTHEAGQPWAGINQTDVSELLLNSRLAQQARLAALETQAWQGARLALQTQAEKLGTKCFFCSRIQALAVPVSATVAPGAEYRAALFLAETPASDFGNLAMTANGHALPVSWAAGSQVELPPAPTPAGQPDTVRRQWQGHIRAHSYPTDTAWSVTVPYSIIKPPAP